METATNRLADFLNGDETAFKKLVEEYQSLVYNVVLPVVKNEEDAADVTQDVFVKIFEKAESFRGKSELSTWIYRIAVHTALDFYKQKRRRIPTDYVYRLFSSGEVYAGAFDHPGVQLENKDNASALFAALDKLPGKQQAVFVLFYMEGRSQKEIAEILEISTGAVESLMSRARHKLQNELNNYYNKQIK